jgi:thioredoxin-like negative regulator of GroEL
LFAAASRNRRYAREAGKDDLLRAFEVGHDREQDVTAARRRLASLIN